MNEAIPPGTKKEGEIGDTILRTVRLVPKDNTSKIISTPYRGIWRRL